MYSQQTKTSDNKNSFSPAASSGTALGLQYKLDIGSVNDPLEAEADAMADRVMRMPESSLIQKKCATCEEEKVQRRPLATAITPFIQTKSTGDTTAGDAVTNQINATKGSGSRMADNTKSFMESRFGTDFSNVKIHTGDHAVQLSRELNAQAFTVGNDIYFNSGNYAPDSESGKHLLAHELTHTVQQGGNACSVQRKIHKGNDNYGSYSFNDTNCTFDYDQNWYFKFEVPISDTEQSKLMAKAAKDVHDVWSNKFPLISKALTDFVHCPCEKDGAAVSVNIKPFKGEKKGRGVKVVVLPKVRANVNPVTGTMKLEHDTATHSDFNGSMYNTGLQYTVAHEFGHTIDITDEYAGWTGFFAPAIQKDEAAIMNTGNEIRTRHYQYFGDMLSLEMIGCRYNPKGIREPERENPVFRVSTLAGLTTYQDGLKFPNVDNKYSLGSNYDLRVSNERILGLFYPKIGGIRLMNMGTGTQSDFGITAGLRLGQIAHPLVFNLSTGIVTNPLDPSKSVAIPLNIQAGFRTSKFEFGLNYTPVFDLLKRGEITHLFGAEVTW